MSHLPHSIVVFATYTPRQSTPTFVSSIHHLIKIFINEKNEHHLLDDHHAHLFI